MEKNIKITNGALIYTVKQIGENKFKLFNNKNEDLSRMNSSKNYKLTTIWQWPNIYKLMVALNMWILEE